MTKRLLDIDDDLLERARNVAGTGTTKEAVNTALQRLTDDEKVRRHIERLRGDGALAPAHIKTSRQPQLSAGSAVSSLASAAPIDAG